MSTGAARVFIQVESEAEQKEHLRQQRQTLKPLVANAIDKENLTGSGRGSIVDQLSRLKAGANLTPKYGKRKCVETTATTTTTQDADTQTEEIPKNDADKPITLEDLTSQSEPGENYYKLLAEQRRGALEKTMIENQHLHERITGLECELNIARSELDEANTLVEILKEMMNESNSESGEEEQTPEHAEKDEEQADA